MNVYIYKAQSVGDREVPDVRILIDRPIAGQGSLEGYRDFYDRQALALENALMLSLPGGTYDQLLCRMLKWKASLLAVPHWEVTDES